MTRPEVTPEKLAAAAHHANEADIAAAHAEQAAAVARIDTATASTADSIRQRIDAAAAPDFFGSDDLYTAIALDHLAGAGKDPTYRATMALIAKLPRDRARAMVERLAIRAWAHGDATARRFLAQLRRETKDAADLDLESAVEVALQRLALDCQAILADLGDVHRWSAHRPGRELATVAVDRLGRDTSEMAVVDLGAPLDGAR